jgi:hypothetical protein
MDGVPNAVAAASAPRQDKPDPGRTYSGDAKGRLEAGIKSLAKRQQEVNGYILAAKNLVTAKQEEIVMWNEEQDKIALAWRQLSDAVSKLEES